MTTKQVLEEVEQEREYQVSRWGNEFDDKNTPYNWNGYISHYAARVLHGVPADVQENQFRRDMIKVAALAVAAVEAYDRKVA